MAGDVVGSAAVEIVPDLSTFDKQLTAGVKASMAKLESAVNAATATIEASFKGAATSADKSLSSVDGNGFADAKESASKAAGAIEADMKSAATDADKKLAAVDGNEFRDVKDEAKKAGNAVDDSFEKGAKAADNHLQNLAKSAGLAAVAVKIGQFAKSSIDAAADLGEATSKAGVLFGEQLGEIEQFAAGAAESLGQSKLEVLDAAGQFAIFGQAAGLAGTDLSEFSTDFVALASDMASFSNTSPQEAVEALGAALRGESEPIRRYGVMLDEATLKAAALELQIYDGNGALTTQQKVLAAQRAIMEQTTNAQGDFARTSESLSNQQKILSAEFKNLQAQVGQQLAPAFGILVSQARVALDLFGKLPGPVQQFVVVGALAVAGLLAMKNAMDAFGISSNKALVALGLLMVPLTALAFAAQQDAKHLREMSAAIGEVTTASDADAMEAWGRAIGEGIFIAKDATEVTKELAEANLDGAKRLQNMVIAQIEAGDTSEVTRTRYALLTSAILEQTTANEEARLAMEKVAEQNEAATTSVEDQTTAIGANKDGWYVWAGQSEVTAQWAEENEKNQRALEEALWDVHTATLASFNADIALEESKFRVSEAIGEYNELNQSLIDGTYEGENAMMDMARAENDVYTAALSAAGAAAEQAKQQAELSGATFTAEDAARAEIAALQEQADTLAPGSPLRKQLLDYIDTLENKIPAEVETRITANLSIIQKETLINGQRIKGPQAEGNIFTRPTGVMNVAEAGAEAIIPITRPRRAMELLEQSGLGAMWDALSGGNRGGDVNVSFPGAVIQDATDVDLVAQRTGAAVYARTLTT